MNYPILSIDKDVEVHARETVKWNERGISTIRVDSMCEAMNKLRSGTFLFIAINADSVNYLPMLPVARQMTGTPIFVITSNFSVHGQDVAQRSGATVYAPRQHSAEENVISALAWLHSYSEAPPKAQERPRFITCKSLFVLPDSHQAFYNDMELPLTNTEFSLLCLLLANRGIVLPFGKILDELWHEDNPVSSPKIVNYHINNLRYKLSVDPKLSESIKTIRGVGYRFDST